MQSIKWYARRIRAMSRSEILWRIESLFRDSIDLIRIPLGLIPNPPACDSGGYREYVPGFCCSPVSPSTWPHTESPAVRAWTSRLIRKADAICANKLSYFDLVELDHGDPIRWHRDHSSGKESSVRLSILTDYRSATTYGDCKLIWEPNRHHQLVVLARAYVATQNKAYSEKIAQTLQSWMAENPFGYGMNWKSPLELAVRAINWVWALDLIRGSDSIDDNLWSDIRTCIYRTMWDCNRRFSQGSSANNHVIGEAAGTFIAACYFSDFPEATKWRDRCKSILEREIQRQTYPDGCTREHAFNYQLFVVQFFLLSRYAGRKAGLSFSTEFDERLRKMMQFLANISSDTGLPPNMGDNDDGYVLDLGDSLSQVQNVLAAGAIEMSDPDLQLTEYSEFCFWMYGLIDRRNIRHYNKSTVYEDSGYAVLRSQHLRVFFDFADLGYGPIAAHGHADCLSFEMAVNGFRVFVDPGTYDYFTYPKWRDYFRSTRAHNTIEIDGESQSVILGSFLWGQRAVPSLIDFSESSHNITITAAHDGYRRLPAPVTHIRTISIDKANETVSICDTFDTEASHDGIAYFHIAETCAVTRLDPNSVSISGPHGQLKFHSPHDAIEILPPSIEPSPGWISPKYHVKIPSTTLLIRKRICASSSVQTQVEILRKERE